MSTTMGLVERWESAALVRGWGGWPASGKKEKRDGRETEAVLGGGVATASIWRKLAVAGEDLAAAAAVGPGSGG